MSKFNSYGLSQSLLDTVTDVLKKGQTVSENEAQHAGPLHRRYISKTHQRLEEAKMDKPDKKELSKDFDDRDDKDIDNDGDSDDSDEYLHKKRKAISKNMKKESYDKKDGDKDYDEKEMNKDKKKEKVDTKPDTKDDVKEDVDSFKAKSAPASTDAFDPPQSKTPKRPGDKDGGEKSIIKQGSSDEEESADGVVPHGAKDAQGSTKTKTPGEKKVLEHEDFGVGTVLQENEDGTFDVLFDHGVEFGVELDELSKKTLGSYVKKAAKDVGKYNMRGMNSSDSKALGSDERAKKHFAKADRREKGIGKAADRLSK